MTSQQPYAALAVNTSQDKHTHTVPFLSLIKLPVTRKVHLWQKVCQVSVRHDAYGETPVRNCLRERRANINLHVELVREQLIPVKESGRKYVLRRVFSLRLIELMVAEPLSSSLYVP